MLKDTQLKKAEEDLAEALRQGRHEALGQLYDQYAPLLLGLICRTITDRELAEEVLRDCFLTVWNRRAEFAAAPAGLASALICLARQTALQSSPSRPGSQEAAPAAASGSARPGSQLTQPQRAALDLVYLQGYSCAEAAKELGLPEETLKATLKEAVRQLRADTAA